MTLRLVLPVHELASRYAAGASSNELARDYGCDWKTVMHRLRLAGVALRTRSQARALVNRKMGVTRRERVVFSAVPKDKLLGLYLVDKLSIGQICAQYGISFDRIRTCLQDLGCQIKRHPGPVGRISVSCDRLKELYVVQEKSVDAIAKELGLTRYAVRVKLRGIGVEFRNRHEVGHLHARRADRHRRVSPGGYAYVYQPTHHRANKQGYTPEHVWVWEQGHGTFLPDDWVVHHLNGVGDDNRPENLAAMPRNSHNKWLLPHLLRARIREVELQVEGLKKSLSEITDYNAAFEKLKGEGR